MARGGAVVTEALPPPAGADAARPLLLSVVIPARDEEATIAHTVTTLHRVLSEASVPFEILVVNDHSQDSTEEVLRDLAATLDGVRWIANQRPGGFGYAVRSGLEAFSGDAVCIVMADASDDPHDVVLYYSYLAQGYECVFGSRFTRHSVVRGYPPHKLLLNRLGNRAISLLFGLDYNDVSNAFKAYRREVIEGIQPILSRQFNLTVELPLKAIVRGYSHVVVPIHWYGRLGGVSQFRIKEMGSRYLFIILYVLLERLLTGADYRRAGWMPRRRGRWPRAARS